MYGGALSLDLESINPFPSLEQFQANIRDVAGSGQHEFGLWLQRYLLLDNGNRFPEGDWILVGQVYIDAATN